MNDLEQIGRVFGEETLDFCHLQNNDRLDFLINCRVLIDELECIRRIQTYSSMKHHIIASLIFFLIDSFTHLILVTHSIVKE